MNSLDTMIATNRFGLGAKPGEGGAASSDPRGWLKQQLRDPAASLLTDAALHSSEAALRDYFEWREKKKKDKKDKSLDATGESPENQPPLKDSPRREIAGEIEARTLFAITTDQSYRERLVRFWSNHFTVSVTSPIVASIAGAFEREAIRPHVTGRFSDLLLAAETHQAMLYYLDNVQSVGPGSRVGKRRGRGLNENLAREILELHTLSVHGGYSQEDVIELARALTGWTVATPRDHVETGKTWFDARRHEPGGRTVLGKRYPEEGASQAADILADLAGRPQTAHFVATKLARHFIADTPPPAAVSRLEKAFLESGGNLGYVSATLVELDEAWGKEQQKFKTPDEFNISALRGLGAKTVQQKALRATYGSLGQAPFTAPSPAGWPDNSAAWLGPDAISKRLEWSGAVAAKVRGRIDPREFLDLSLGALASPDTRFMINGADSREQGMTLALMSPEFQRR